MARQSDDPYGDFVVRITNSCRMAIGQHLDMSDDEYNVVCRILDRMKELDPVGTEHIRKATIVIRPR